MSRTFVASGNISPSVFVKMTGSTSDNKVSECTGSDRPCGVSKAGTRNPGGLASDDGLAAIAGEDLHVFTAGDECMIQLGGTVVAGDMLKPHTDGTGLAGSSTDICGAQALAAGVSGELIPCKVIGVGVPMA